MGFMTSLISLLGWIYLVYLDNVGFKIQIRDLGSNEIIY